MSELEQEATVEVGTFEVEEAPARNEKGQFAPKESEAGEPERRFKTWEEAEKAWENANAALGRQGQEYGQLQQQVNELLNRTPAEREQPMNDATFEALIERNPAKAAEYARKIGNEELENYVLDSWAVESPSAVTQYQIDKALGKFRDDLSTTVAPLKENANKAEVARAWGQAKHEIPDLEKYAPAIYELAQSEPEMIEVAFGDEGTPEQRVKAIRNLYRLAKFQELEAGGSAPPPAEAPEEPGFVVSGSQAREPKVRTSDDDFLDAFDKAAAKYYRSDLA